MTYIIQSVDIERHNRETLRASEVELGSFVRARLDEVMKSRKDVPTEQRDRVRETVHTSVNVTLEQAVYLAENDINIARFVDESIEDVYGGGE